VCVSNELLSATGEQSMKDSSRCFNAPRANSAKSAAFVFHEEVWTYERLAAEAELLARGLAARGVRPGDRVVLHMMSRPEMVVAYYACFQLGLSRHHCELRSNSPNLRPFCSD
jgi:acyl-CoA synthetase (AMP-forming)/AMP-acid ligase II